jgi:thioredoxin-like negative regulator of GroEL
LLTELMKRRSGEVPSDFQPCFHRDRYQFNVDENRDVAMSFGIQSIPMQLFFANGEKVNELLGAVPESHIRRKVAEVLEKHPTDERGRLKTILF